MNKENIRKIFTDCELPYFWKAYKKDGSILSQFEEVAGEVKENLYSEIDRKPEDFKKFELVNTDNNLIIFSVDLETGDFLLNGIIIRNNINITGRQLQCIFWRKKNHVLNKATESIFYSHYTLGWQTNIDGINIKKEYKIFSDSSVQEIMQKQHRKLFVQASIIKNK